MRLVIIESPFRADDENTARLNTAYARRCLKDSLMRGEAPFASHLLYTQEGVLDDADSYQRAIGLRAAGYWYKVVDICAVYTDLGITEGMQRGIKAAERECVEIDYRMLKPERSSP